MLSYPTLIVSEAGEHTDKAFRAQVDQINALEAQLNALKLELIAATKKIPTLQQLAKDLQLGGQAPLNITGLPGTPSQGIPEGSAPAHEFVTGVTAAVGTTPGVLTYGQPSASDLTNGVVGSGAVVLASTLGTVAAGTYTVGAKLTGPGVNGTITIGANGQITAIQEAT
jgi:hypothetical protein